MSNDEATRLLSGCGHSCVFRFPKIGGQATNGPCRCVGHNMTPTETVELRKKIRDLVNYAAALRSAVADKQKQLQDQPRDPNEIILGC